MSETHKDTIYIDIDDEITSIIDKVRSSGHKIIALVLPKRASMLQSSVNMKLLKKAADDVKKQIVLITSEAGLLPLAGSVGLYVAKTLQSKPELAEAVEAPGAAAIEALSLDDEVEPEFDAKTSGSKSIGKLAGMDESEMKESTKKAKPELTPLPIPRPAEDKDDVIELDNTTPEEAPAASKTKKSKNKKLKVPDFEKFRVRLILGGVAFIILIIAWILANIILPKATVTVATNSSSVNTSVTFNVDPAAKALDVDKQIVPGDIQQTQKTSTQQVDATGQKNQGDKATGLMTITNCNDSAVTLPAGTGFSSNGLTFISQSSLVVAGSDFFSNGSCKGNGQNSVKVTAQNGGTNYNLAAQSYTIASSSVGNLKASGSAMTGGTDDIVKVVAQADIDNAKQKLGAQDQSAVKSELQNSLKSSGFYALTATFNAADPTITNSANVGDQAANVTVTQAVTYYMFGIKQKDLQKLIDNDVKKQIDTSKQGILDDGFGSATFNVVSQSPAGAQLGVQTTATAGPDLNLASLKKQIAGKKAGEVRTIIGNNPGVTKVTVHYSPFWVSSTPKKASKVNIVIEKPKPANAKP